MLTCSSSWSQPAQMKRTTHLWWWGFPRLLSCYTRHVGDVAGVMTPFMSPHTGFKQAQSCHPYHHWVRHAAAYISLYAGQSTRGPSLIATFTNVMNGDVTQTALNPFMLCNQDRIEAAVRGRFDWDALRQCGMQCNKKLRIRLCFSAATQATKLQTAHCWLSFI